MVKKLALLAFLILLLVLTSCTMPTVSRGKLNRALTENFFVGNQGLQVTFLDQAPPAELFETTEFDVQMFISNLGAFSLAEEYSAKANIIYDKLKVEKITDKTTTYSSSYIKDGIVSLYGKSYYYPQGEQNYFAIDRFRAKEVPTNFETSKFDFGLNICYPYQTTFAESICIDSDPQNSNIRTEACQAEDKSYGRGQGAPIVITAIDVQMIPRGTLVQPRFVIYIKNEGNGLVYKFQEDLMEQHTLPNGEVTKTCGDLRTAKANQMVIEAQLGEEPLDCSLPVLRAGETKIECQLSDSKISGNTANYMSTLQVKLKYFYTEVFSKEITIKQADSTLLSSIKPLGPSYCAFYETYDETEKTCLTNCEYYAKNNPAFLENTKKLILPHDQNWEGLSCSYSDYKTCKLADNLCTTNSDDLCMKGQYCGWPKCVYNNIKPQIIDQKALGSPTVEYVWTCDDSDDKVDITHTCGCKTIGYYKFLDSGLCSKLELKDMNKIEGKLGFRGIQFSIPIPPETKKLCVAVEDKLGKMSIITANI